MSDLGRPVAEDELHAYVDELLEPARRAEIEQYLRAHPDLLERVRAYAAQRSDLRAAFAPLAEEPIPASLDLWSLVEARLTRPRPRFAGWKVAAAILVAAVGGATGAWLLKPAPASGVQLIAQEAAASYAVFTVDPRRPVELWAAQGEDLKRWVSNRLGRPVSPPDLTGVGYQLLGGRVVPTAHGPAGMFMYENAAHTRLVVFVRPMVTVRSTGIEQVEAGRFDACAWVDAGVGYSVVAQEPYERLLELSRHVRQQTSRG